MHDIAKIIVHTYTHTHTHTHTHTKDYMLYRAYFKMINMK